MGKEWKGMWIGIEGILGIGMGKESRNHGNRNWKECKFQGRGVKFYSSSADTFNMVSLLGCEFEHINDIKSVVKIL